MADNPFGIWSSLPTSPFLGGQRSAQKALKTVQKQGIIVPARDVKALADAILWCCQYPEESQAMGRAAQARVESGFTLEHYNQRVIALYRALGGCIT
jgi:glycosyltransferase involved in cell wall biosynthesis